MIGMSRLYTGANFENDKIDDIICIVCLDIFYEPVTIENCGHTFCNECIGGWLKLHDNCPTCKQACGKTIRNKYIEINRLNALKYKCLNGECGKSFEVGMDCRNIREHKILCMYERISCEYCKAEICRKEVDKHNKT